MLNILNGDLFANISSPCIIAHGCNARGVMAAGFAKILREKYPENYMTYQMAHKHSRLVRSS